MYQKAPPPPQNTPPTQNVNTTTVNTTTALNFPQTSKFKSSDVGLIVLFCMMTVVLICWSCYYCYQYSQNRPNSWNNIQNGQLGEFRSLPSRLKIVIMPGQTLQYAIREDEEPSRHSRPALYEVSVNYNLEKEEKSERIRLVASKSWHGCFGSQHETDDDSYAQGSSGFESGGSLDSKSWHAGMKYQDKQEKN